MRILRLYARVLGELRGERGLAILLGLANLVLAASQFAEPVLFGRLIDVLTSRVAPARGAAPSPFVPLVLAWVAVGLFNIAAGVSVALHADRLANRQRLSVLGRYFEHVLVLPLSFHAGTHSGRVANAMWSGSDAMCVLWLGFFREHLASLLALVVLLPCTIFLDLRLGLMLVGLVALFAILTSAIVRKTQALQSEVRRIHVSMVEHAADSLGNLPVIQSFTRASAELREQRAIARRLLEAQMPVLSWWALASMATRAASTLTATSILLLGAWLVTHGRASVGDVVAFMTLAILLIGRLESTLGFVSSLFVESSKIEEFFGILDSVPTVRDADGSVPLVNAKGKVAYESVGFSYERGKQALVDVSFEVAPGETIALVGATGSGKSTTLGLLYRAHEPSRGRILVDDVDVRAYTLDSLRENIAVVFQEPMLFARSIRENLLVGKPDATDDELDHALARAQALELVAGTPAGLDTVLGERGRSLSGGERQRLSIARALLKDPPILILDEATAALDAKTEAKLKLALDEVMKGRTTFVIAHRLSTIRDATRILVFDRGRILESGTFDELVARKGAFAELAKAQLGIVSVESG